MKTTSLGLFAGILPLLTPIAMAEPSANPPVVKTTNETKGTAAAWRASEIIGTNVKNAADETIGEVEDLAVDLKTGEVLAVVISSGGFLGIADTLSSVPSSALRYDIDAKAFKTKLTKEQLVKAPQHKSGESPDYNDKTVSAKLREFRDSIGGDVTAPDNTANNETDAAGKSLTPVDQGNSEADLATTKNIRSAVIGTDLSFNAKNVKIITKDGNVTLRGVVNNHEEHKEIVAIAEKHAGESKVHDQLTVKKD